MGSYQSGGKVENDTHRSGARSRVKTGQRALGCSDDDDERHLDDDP